MKAASLRRVLNVYPPFLFGGIKVEEISDDFRYARVRLKLRWYNRNYVRTAFGGNLFSMTDPFWMIMVMESLGKDYVVWDKAAEIEFVAPGKEDVFAEFRLDDGILDELRCEAADNRKVLRWFGVEIKTRGGEVIARVRKQLYVRRKRLDAA